MKKLLLILISLSLTACIGETVVYSLPGVVLPDVVKENISAQYLDECKHPMVWTEVEIPPMYMPLLRAELGKHRDYFLISNLLISDEHKEADTVIFLDTDASNSIGMYYGYAPAVNIIYIRWMEMPSDTTIERILMHEMGHRYTLGHTERTDEQRPNAMYYMAINEPASLTDEQWKPVCKWYVSRLMNRWERWFEENSNAAETL